MVRAICLYVYVRVCMFCSIILYVLDSGSSNVLIMSSWGKRRLEKEKEEAKKDKAEEKKEKIPIVGEGCSGGTTYLEVSRQGKIQYTSPITPNSALHIRNRMLSKLGAKVLQQVACDWE